MTTIRDLSTHLRQSQTDRRQIVAIAGAPGSGKSTLAETLVDDLNATSTGSAAILPMDGYHYDDLYLEPAGLRPRKGAPETFDVGGFAATLKRLRANEEPTVAVPVFDRDIEIARAGARLIPSSVEIIVAEGNYLLLDRTPWSDLQGLYDTTVLIEVPAEELERRLKMRWQRYDLSEDVIRQKLEENDLPNGRLVRNESVRADFVIVQG